MKVQIITGAATTLDEDSGIPLPWQSPIQSDDGLATLNFQTV